LLARLRGGGDDDSWRTFVDLYGPLVFSYCRKRGLQDADAADVAQEVLVRVVRSMPTFAYTPEKGRFRHWLGTIARNEVARLRRKQLRAAQPNSPHAKPALDEIAGTEPDSEWAGVFNAETLRVALERIRASFEATTWQAFEYVWEEHGSALEAATNFRMPVDQVYAAKSRVLKRLRAELLLLAEDMPRCVPLR
jgi:RNA polymerase sigma-70 factor (ECF subfamily)